MLAPVSTQDQHYIKLNNQNLPINLTPAGIKCISCGQYYQQRDLQSHLATHVNPQYLKPSPLAAKGPGKLNLRAILDDPQKIEQSEIYVKSMLEADLPQIDTTRKQANFPTGQIPDFLISQVSRIAMNNPDSKDITESLGDIEEQNLDEFEQLNIRRNIQLRHLQKPVEKKKIKVYMNEGKEVSNYDNTIMKQKTHKDDQTDVSDGYTVTEPEKEQGQGWRINIPLMSARMANSEHYMIPSRRKQPHRPLHISTASRVIHPSSRDAIKLQDSRSTVAPHHLPVHDPHNHECPCCHGFYCSQCKSSVPPIYRPVPDSDGNYHFHPSLNERSIEFYQNHYYRRDINVCTSCEMKNESGRMVDSRSVSRIEPVRIDQSRNISRN